MSCETPESNEAPKTKLTKAEKKTLAENAFRETLQKIRTVLEAGTPVDQTLRDELIANREALTELLSERELNRLPEKDPYAPLYNEAMSILEPHVPIAQKTMSSARKRKGFGGKQELKMGENGRTYVARQGRK